MQGAQEKHMSTLSIGSMSGVSINASMTPSVKMERDLLERMVQDRDDKITTLHKTVAIQKQHAEKLRHDLDETRLRLKQDQTRSKLQNDNVSYERDLAQMQLRALTQEQEKYKDTVFALHSPSNDRRGPAGGGGGGPTSPSAPTQVGRFGGAEEPGAHTPAQTETAHALYLQSQLYQAMHSISALQIQATALKENCDAVVNSLEEDLTETTTLKHQIEVELMSQLTQLEREKNVMEGLFEEKIRIMEDKLKKYEEKIRDMEGLDESSSVDSEDSGDRQLQSAVSLNTVEESDTDEYDSIDIGGKGGHDQMESLLTDLETMPFDTPTPPMRTLNR